LDNDLKLDESFKDLISFKKWDTAEPQHLADILVRYCKADDCNAEDCVKEKRPKLFAVALKGVLLRKLSSLSHTNQERIAADAKTQPLLEKLKGEVAELMQDTEARLDSVCLEDEYC
jgi:hypothetical protein